MSSKLLLLVACASLLFAGCSTKRDARDLMSSREIHTLVVDARLLVGLPLPPITLRQTLAPWEPYDAQSAAVREASVRVRSGDSLWVYLESLATPGRYGPPRNSRVLPETEYVLEVEVPDGRHAWARTFTPPAFEIDQWVMLDEATGAVVDTLRTFDDMPPGQGEHIYGMPENQLQYQRGFLEARFHGVEVPAYQVGLASLDEGSEVVLDADFLSEEDLADLPRSITSSPLAIEDAKLRMPWFAIYFAGRYKLWFYAVDENWYDLVRSMPELGGSSGFGGNSGDEFERPLFHIDGGIGLFGSASVDSVGFYIHPKP